MIRGAAIGIGSGTLSLWAHRYGLAVATFALLSALIIARRLDPLPEGLRGTYFTGASWASASVHSSVDAPPSTTRIFAVWRASPPETFSATWSGSFVAFREGPYTFATLSDDGSWVYVDGQLVVDNGGSHGAQTRTGTITLAPGVHTLFIRYFQGGGPFEFQLLWSPPGSPLSVMPSWVLAARTADLPRFLLSIGIRLAAMLLGVVGLVLAAVIGITALWRSATRPDWTVELGLLVSGAALLIFVLPHEIEGDGRIRYLALAELIEWHGVSRTPYSLVGPLVSAPLYFLGKFVGTPDWWCARFNTFVFLAGLWAMGTLLRDRMDRQTRDTFLLLLMAASMFPYHLEGYFAEVFTAVCVAVGLLAVRSGHTAAGWTAAVTGAINTPASLGGLGLAAAVEAWDTRQVRHFIAPVIAAFGLMAESWLRRGSPFATGYEGNFGATTLLPYSGKPGFSYPLAFGVLSITLSFGKGIFYYAPGLLLPLRRTVEVNRLWIAFLIGLILVYARWWAWWGGLFWGPRFFLFASVPAALALADWIGRSRDLRLRDLWIALVFLTLSAWIAVEGAMFDFAGLGACRTDATEWLCLYVPEFSALWRPFVEWTAPTARQWIIGAFCLIVYLRFATPIVRELVLQNKAAAAAIQHARVRRGAWRF